MVVDVVVDKGSGRRQLERGESLDDPENPRDARQVEDESLGDRDDGAVDRV